MLINIIMSLPRLRLRLRNSSRRCAAAAWAATALARALALAAAARAAALAAAARAAAALAAARCRCSSFLRHFVPFDRDPCCFFLYLAVCFCPWASTMFETVHLQHVWETPFFLFFSTNNFSLNGTLGGPQECTYAWHSSQKTRWCCKRELTCCPCYKYCALSEPQPIQYKGLCPREPTSGCRQPQAVLPTSELCPQLPSVFWR